MNHLVYEDVNIYELPQMISRSPTQSGFEVTIGDLHGNAIKLLFFLIKHGIAQNLTRNDYHQLVVLYTKDNDELTKEDLERYKAILGKIKFNNHTKVRLIGDELADRGSNDYFTLLLFEKLHQKKVPLEILVSNHGIEFIEATETQGNTFHASMLGWVHGPSLERLNVLVDKGLVKREEIFTISREAYKPTLKAISYTLNERNSVINIYSHAGIGLNTIKDLAVQWGVPYSANSALSLARTIDGINTVFQSHVRAKSVYTLYTKKQMREGYGGIADPKAAFVMVMWNRDYDGLDRPSAHGDFAINFIHGHDSDEPTNENIYNLDNLLGKLIGFPWNEGKYTVLCTRGKRIATANALFDVQLRLLADKRDDFNKRKSQSNDRYLNEQLQMAYTTADQLHVFLKEAGEAYFLNPDSASFNDFKAKVTVKINEAHEELDKHRGWSPFLNNLLLAITTLGIGLLVQGAKNLKNNRNFFFALTASTKLLDDMTECVHNAGVTAGTK